MIWRTAILALDTETTDCCTAARDACIGRCARCATSLQRPCLVRIKSPASHQSCVSYTRKYQATPTHTPQGRYTLLLLNLYLRIFGRSIPQSQSKTNHSPLRFQLQIFMPSSRQNHQSPVQQRPRFTRTCECGLVTSFALLPILLPLFPLNATLRFTDTNFSTRRLMGMSGR